MLFRQGRTHIWTVFCIFPTLNLIKRLILTCKEYQVESSKTTDGLDNTRVVESSVRTAIGQLFPIINHYNISVFQDSVMFFSPIFIFYILHGSSFPFLQSPSKYYRLQSSTPELTFHANSRLLNQTFYWISSQECSFITVCLKLSIFFKLFSIAFASATDQVFLIIHYPKFVSVIVAVIS